MTNSTPFHKIVRAARKAQHLTQGELAEKVGCTQSTISHFETGSSGAASEELIGKLAAYLGVKREEDAPTALEEFIREKPGSVAFCPNSDCLAASHFVLNGKQVIRPWFFEIVAGPSLTHCSHCGEGLEVGCPACLTPLVAGASFCSGCGSAMVRPTEKPEDVEEFVARMQERNAAYMAAQPKVESLPVPRLRNTVQT